MKSGELVKKWTKQQELNVKIYDGIYSTTASKYQKTLLKFNIKFESLFCFSFDHASKIKNSVPDSIPTPTNNQILPSNLMNVIEHRK